MKNLQLDIIKILRDRYPALLYVENEMIQAIEMLHSCALSDKKILLCGNGGSASDADHIVGELMKSFLKKRKLSPAFTENLKTAGGELGERISRVLQQGVRAISLTHHPALSTAFTNDVDPFMIFAQQVSILGDCDDLLWAISTSGNSKNVLYAAVTARAKGMKILGMTGETGGLLSDYCDICIKIPEKETHLIQEFHIQVYHALCMLLEEILWPD